MEEGSKLFLFIIIFIVQGLFFATWVYYFLNEFRSAFRKSAPRVYKSIFLNCSDKALQLEIEKEAQLEKLAPVISNLDAL
jgi:hypothetical protein